MDSDIKEIIELLKRFQTEELRLRDGSYINCIEEEQYEKLALALIQEINESN